MVTKVNLCHCHLPVKWVLSRANCEMEFGDFLYFTRMSFK